MISDEKYVNILSSQAERVKTEVNVNNQDITITQNGEYRAESPYTGFGLVSVAVPNGTERLSVTTNGVFRPSGANIGFDEVSVEVETADLTTKTITENGTYNASSDNVDGYSSVEVNVPTPKYYGIPAANWARLATEEEGTPNFSGLVSIPAYFCYNTFEGCQNLIGAANFDTIRSISSAGLLGAFNSTGLTGISFNALVSVSASGLAWAFTECANLTGIISFPRLENIIRNSMSCFEHTFDSTNIISADFSALRTIAAETAFVECFSYCSNLTSINFNSLISITGNNAFSYAFQYTGLTNISFPALTTITGEYAFESAFNFCESLTSLSFPALTTVASEDKGIFYDMLTDVSGCTVHFPAALQATIGNWADVLSGFGGTNTVVLFDL